MAKKSGPSSLLEHVVCDFCEVVHVNVTCPVCNLRVSVKQELIAGLKSAHARYHGAAMRIRHDDERFMLSRAIDEVFDRLVKAFDEPAVTASKPAATPTTPPEVAEEVDPDEVDPVGGKDPEGLNE